MINLKHVLLKQAKHLCMTKKSIALVKFCITIEKKNLCLESSKRWIGWAYLAGIAHHVANAEDVRGGVALVWMRDGAATESTERTPWGWTCTWHNCYRKKKVRNRKVYASVMILFRHSKTSGWHLANGLTLCSFFPLQRAVHLTSPKLSTARTPNGKTFWVNWISSKLHWLFDSITSIT